MIQIGEIFSVKIVFVNNGIGISDKQFFYQRILNYSLIICIFYKKSTNKFCLMNLLHC